MPNTTVLKENSLPTRQPAVAGQFYPDDPAELKSEISRYLAEVNIEPRAGAQVVIVPHAGYEYSAPVAAWAYKAIEGLEINTVVLIGSSHVSGFEGAALHSLACFQTPMGRIEVDWELTEKIVATDKKFFINDSIHADEHSLEVQLPFLQTVLKADFKIIPVSLGKMEDSLSEKLARTLGSVLDFEKSLVVVSSDLSHYPDYAGAQSSDRAVARSILTGDVKRLDEAVRQKENAGIPGLVTAACGAEAIRVGMRIAKLIGAGRIELLSQANSGDVSGDRSRVVGYASIIFESDQGQKIKSAGLLSKAEKTELIKIAREAVLYYLKTGRIMKPSPFSPALNDRRGAFVTLHKQGELRGCIGLFEPEESLARVVAEMAVSAAFNDPRFPPIIKSELNELEFEISVLSPLERVSSADEIEVGIHGVEVVKGANRGVYLPQVAVENNMTKEEFLESLCVEKAGIGSGCWQDAGTELYVFTAEVFNEKECD